MATFAARVAAYTGHSANTTELAAWLSDGATDVTRRIIFVNPDIMYRFATIGTIGTSGLDLAAVIGAKALDVYRDTFESVEVPASMRFRLDRSTSLYRATERSPKHYYLNSTIFVKPDPTGTTPGYASYIIPYVVGATTSTITNFPDDLEYLVVLYASMQDLLSLMSDLMYPDDVVEPVIPLLGDYTSVTVSLPTYVTVPRITLPTLPAGANVDFSGIGSTPSFTNPDAPAFPVLSLGSDLTISTLTLTSAAPVLEDIDIFAGTITAFGTAPVYTPPALTLASVVALESLDIPIPSVIDFSISKTLTDAIEVTGITLPVLELPSAPTITELDLSSLSPPVQPIDPNFSTPSITMATEPVYVAPVALLNLTTALNTITTHLDTNEDIELAVTKINQVQIITNQLQTDIQNSINDFNEMNTIYQAELQKEIEEARLINSKEASEYAAKVELYKASMEGYIASVNAEVQTFANNEVQYRVNFWINESNARINEYQAIAGATIQRYANEIASKANLTAAEVSIYGSELQRKSNLSRAEIDKYQAELNGALQKWNLEEIQGKQANWISQRNTEISKYQADIQNELNSFNASNVEYQAAIQKNITEAANQIASESEEQRLKLQEFAQEVNKYQIRVNTEIQEYLQTVGSEVTEWTTKRSNWLQEFQIKTEAELQRYASELNEKAQEYDADFKAWVELINKSIATFQQETGYDLGLYQAEVGAVVNKHSEDVKNSVEEFNSGINKYRAELEKVTEYNTRTLNKYVAQSQTYQYELAGIINAFMSKLQKRQAQLNHYLELYARLKMQYEQGFVPFQKENKQ